MTSQEDEEDYDDDEYDDEFDDDQDFEDPSTSQSEDSAYREVEVEVDPSRVAIRQQKMNEALAQGMTGRVCAIPGEEEDQSSRPESESPRSAEQSPRSAGQSDLPPGWEKSWSEEHQREYYFNRSTKESRWTHPVVDSESEEQSPRSAEQPPRSVGQSDLPPGWEKAWSEEHKREYYFNLSTNESRWEPPVADSKSAPAVDASSAHGTSPSEEEALPEGLCIGDQVVSLVDFDGMYGETLRSGDVGVVLGAAEDADRVRVRFPNMQSVPLLPAQFEKQAAQAADDTSENAVGRGADLDGAAFQFVEPSPSPSGGSDCASPSVHSSQDPQEPAGPNAIAAPGSDEWDGTPGDEMPEAPPALETRPIVAEPPETEDFAKAAEMDTAADVGELGEAPDVDEMFRAPPDPETFEEVALPDAADPLGRPLAGTPRMDETDEAQPLGDRTETEHWRHEVMDTLNVTRRTSLADPRPLPSAEDDRLDERKASRDKRDRSADRRSRSRSPSRSPSRTPRSRSPRSGSARSRSPRSRSSRSGSFRSRGSRSPRSRSPSGSRTPSSYYSRRSRSRSPPNSRGDGPEEPVAEDVAQVFETRPPYQDSQKSAETTEQAPQDVRAEVARGATAESNAEEPVAMDGEGRSRSRSKSPQADGAETPDGIVATLPGFDTVTPSAEPAVPCQNSARSTANTELAPQDTAAQAARVVAADREDEELGVCETEDPVGSEAPAAKHIENDGDSSNSEALTPLPSTAAATKVEEEAAWCPRLSLISEKPAPKWKPGKGPAAQAARAIQLRSSGVNSPGRKRMFSDDTPSESSRPVSPSSAPPEMTRSLKSDALFTAFRATDKAKSGGHRVWRARDLSGSMSSRSSDRNSPSRLSRYQRLAYDEYYDDDGKENEDAEIPEGEAPQVSEAMQNIERAAAEAMKRAVAGGQSPKNVAAATDAAFNAVAAAASHAREEASANGLAPEQVEAVEAAATRAAAGALDKGLSIEHAAALATAAERAAIADISDGLSLQEVAALEAATTEAAAAALANGFSTEQVIEIADRVERAAAEARKTLAGSRENLEAERAAEVDLEPRTDEAHIDHEPSVEVEVAVDGADQKIEDPVAQVEEEMALHNSDDTRQRDMRLHLEMAIKNLDTRQRNESKETLPEEEMALKNVDTRQRDESKERLAEEDHIDVDEPAEEPEQELDAGSVETNAAQPVKPVKKVAIDDSDMPPPGHWRWAPTVIDEEDEEELDVPEVKRVLEDHPLATWDAVDEYCDTCAWDERRDIYEGAREPARDKLKALIGGRKVMTEAEKFLELLRQRGDGSVGVAWRRYFDTDGDGALSFIEFCDALACVGYEGDVLQLWQDFGGDSSNELGLEVLDAQSAEILEFFTNWCVDQFGGPMEMFQALDDDGSDSLEKDEFALGIQQQKFFSHRDLPKALHSLESVLSTLFPLLDSHNTGVIQPEQLLFLERDEKKRKRWENFLRRKRDGEYGTLENDETPNLAESLIKDVAWSTTRCGKSHWALMGSNAFLDPPPSQRGSRKSSSLSSLSNIEQFKRKPVPRFLREFREAKRKAKAIKNAPECLAPADTDLPDEEPVQIPRTAEPTCLGINPAVVRSASVGAVPVPKKDVEKQSHWFGLPLDPSSPGTKPLNRKVGSRSPPKRRKMPIVWASSHSAGRKIISQRKNYGCSFVNAGYLQKQGISYEVSQRSQDWQNDFNKVGANAVPDGDTHLGNRSKDALTFCPTRTYDFFTASKGLSLFEHYGIGHL